ncbi:hypothetical protein [Piscinibacter sp.]|uniref:hypothetical protein n=1 Tax=Piscinibacter sp. TaxID=1903157 RepID=UPI002D0EF45A|nr:hypothetical protein [Albitalea sp.]HUG23368.1 hypothetical protein [Albitalea sp.]
MLNLLRSLIPGKRHGAATRASHAAEPPTDVVVADAGSFSISSHLSHENGFPLLDWKAARAWVDTLADSRARSAAWAQCEQAWLEHLRSALGPACHLRKSGDSLLLSTLEPNVANATLEFMSKTLRRVVRVLEGIAQAPEEGKHILIVFDDDDTYYRYVSHCYPTAGEFAASSGMYINAGCGHFVTVKSDLRAVEPVIAHEMTHACLSHLPIPAWLNEGLAVNTEHRLSPSGMPTFTPRQMHAKHLAFWGDAEIQEFWSGKSFLRNDDASMLSYDLARILVSQLSGDWERFRSFALNADLSDAGASAGREHLRLDLGAVASVLLEREAAAAWTPDPATWLGAPERGAFR